MKMWIAFRDDERFTRDDVKSCVVYPIAGGVVNPVSLFNTHFVKGETENEVRIKMHKLIDEYFLHKKHMRELPEKAAAVDVKKQAQADDERRKLREDGQPDSLEIEEAPAPSTYRAPETGTDPVPKTGTDPKPMTGTDPDHLNLFEL